jgi:hypothetical protein
MNATIKSMLQSIPPRPGYRHTGSPVIQVPMNLGWLTPLSSIQWLGGHLDYVKRVVRQD